VHTAAQAQSLVGLHLNIAAGCCITVWMAAGVLHFAWLAIVWAEEHVALSLRHGCM
jgi:hypothetical protein